MQKYADYVCGYACTRVREIYTVVLAWPGGGGGGTVAGACKS